MSSELFFIFEDGITTKDIKKFLKKQKAKLQTVKKQEGNTTKATRKRKSNDSLKLASPTKLKKSKIETQYEPEDSIINITSSDTSKCCYDFESDSGIDGKCNDCSEKSISRNISESSSKPLKTNKLDLNQLGVCKSKNCNGKKSTKRLDRLRRKQFKEKLQKYLSQSNIIADDTCKGLQNGDSCVDNAFFHSVDQEKDYTVAKSLEFVTYNNYNSVASPDNCNYAKRDCSSSNSIITSGGTFINTETNHTQSCFGMPEGECEDRPTVLYSTVTEENNLNTTNLSETYCKCHSHFGQPPSDFVSLDCEFVGVGIRKTNALGRCSIVDYNGSIIYDEYCRPDSPITDYRTKWSGIRRKHMKQALPFDIVQKKIISLIKDKVVVGHALFNDFKVLQYEHPPCMIRDTSTYIPLRQKAGLAEKQKISLKNLSKTLLGLDIQQKEHCSIEDSQAAMRLYKLVQFPWEQDIADKHNYAKSDAEKIQDDFPSTNIQEIKQTDKIKDVCHKVDCYKDLQSFQSQEYVVSNSYLEDEFWPCDLFE